MPSPSSPKPSKLHIDPLDAQIGQRLRQRRNELGISQKQVADLLAVSFQQIQKYEKGVNRVSASSLKRLALFLQAELDWFFH